MVSKLITKLLLVVAAVSQIALASPAHAAKSAPTIAAEQQMESKLKQLQVKRKENKTISKEEGRELSHFLHDYLVKLAGDIDRDLTSGRFIDADKEIKEFTKERKFLRDLGHPFLDALKFRQLSEAEELVVQAAVKRAQQMTASIEAALQEERYSEVKSMLLPQFQEMFDTIHDLGHSKKVDHLYRKIIRLGSRAKNKIAIPSGTYHFQSKDFRYTVKVVWKGFTMNYYGEGSGKFPKTMKWWKAAAQGEVPDNLIKLFWQGVASHRKGS